MKAILFATFLSAALAVTCSSASAACWQNTMSTASTGSATGHICYYGSANMNGYKSSSCWGQVWDYNTGGYGNWCQLCGARRNDTVADDEEQRDEEHCSPAHTAWQKAQAAAKAASGKRSVDTEEATHLQSADDAVASRENECHNVYTSYTYQNNIYCSSGYAEKWCYKTGYWQCEKCVQSAVSVLTVCGRDQDLAEGSAPEASATSEWDPALFEKIYGEKPVGLPVFDGEGEEIIDNGLNEKGLAAAVIAARGHPEQREQELGSIQPSIQLCYVTRYTRTCSLGGVYCYSG
jgi:hypothetical protein